MRSIIKSQRVQWTEAPAPVPSPGAGRAADVPHEKTVRLLEDGGRTHAIELTCSCGEVTLLELRYDDAPAAAPAPEAHVSATHEPLVAGPETAQTNDIESEDDR